MAASVRIEDEAFSDARIAALGSLAGYNSFEALGRMAHLWRLCTQRGIYVVSEVLVRSCLGREGVEAIVGAELGEHVEGGIRVKGTAGRIEWLDEVRSAATAGGKARAASARREGGRFVSHQPAGPATTSEPPALTSDTPTSPQGVADPPDFTSGSPAVTSRLDQRHQRSPASAPAETSAPAPAPAHEREIGPSDETLTLAETEQLGFERCGALTGSSAARMRRLEPRRSELVDALRTEGRSWKYLAKVIESAREEATRPVPEYRQRDGPKSRSAFRDVTEELMQIAEKVDAERNGNAGVRGPDDSIAGVLPAARR